MRLELQTTAENFKQKLCAQLLLNKQQQIWGGVCI